MITLIVDAMGGDLAPEAAVEGAAMASHLPELSLILVGDQPVIQKLLARVRYRKDQLQVVHAPDYVRMDEKPQDALRLHPEASIVVALRMLASGTGDALVSAGNTGACILAAARILPRLPGIRRTALAAVYPTERRHGPYGDPFALMLDVGATLEASADDLVRFAWMGSVYASVISRNPRPRVALLSNGEEAMKGTPEIVQAHARLRKMPTLNFMGNVEGVDIPRGTADVIVCNGFTGNIVLKVLEGINEVVSDLAHYAAERSIVWKLGMALLSRGIRKVLELTDWERYGGAPVLGFEKVLIKAHGRSGPKAFRNAIKVAAKAVRGDVCRKIAEGIEGLPAEAEAAGETPPVKAPGTGVPR